MARRSIAFANGRVVPVAFSWKNAIMINQHIRIASSGPKNKAETNDVQSSHMTGGKIKGVGVRGRRRDRSDGLDPA